MNYILTKFESLIRIQSLNEEPNEIFTSKPSTIYY